ncbi:MAG TPA: DnaJ domain-containing protein [Planctomycetota bacterium]|jgi:hypothetical protein|nr:DnaJ domain-containing protein [Planctomycetota bacterium]
MPRSEVAALLQSTPADKLLQIFEESYPADLVNILLDLKKAPVKQVFETLSRIRKRAIAESATLYYYKEYLVNPLPLKVDTDAGISIPNYYAILGVPRDASGDDLKMAHRLLERAHDPEVFSQSMRKLGEERLAEINDAYQHLKTEERRAKVDRLLPNVSYLYPRREQSWLDHVTRLIE